MNKSLCPETAEIWDGDTIDVKPTAEATIALAQIKVVLSLLGHVINLCLFS